MEKSGGRGPCELKAGFGTDHVGYGQCKFHGGNTPSGKKTVQDEQLQDLVVRYGASVSTDPHTALLDELERTAGHVVWLQAAIGEGSLEDSSGPRDVKLVQSAFGIDSPSVWLQLYHKERIHLKEVARACVSAGVEERQIKLAEGQGQELAARVRDLLEDLGIDLREDAVQKLIRRHLVKAA